MASSKCDGQYIYFDSDDINNIYFNVSGSIGLVLPKFSCIKYVDFDSGQLFGILDIVSSMIKLDQPKINDWIFHKQKLKRSSTVMTDKSTQLLSLSINDLSRLQQQFEGEYDGMFHNADK